MPWKVKLRRGSDHDPLKERVGRSDGEDPVGYRQETGDRQI
jgi:hypothetical protein